MVFYSENNAAIRRKIKVCIELNKMVMISNLLLQDLFRRFNPMLAAKARELKNMYNTHYNRYNQNAGQSTKSDKLLLFYSVECGLKYLILIKHGKSSTKRFDEILDETGTPLIQVLSGKNGHNIKKLLKILNVGRYSLPDIPTKMKDDRDKIITAACAEYNQVWRYGIEWSMSLLPWNFSDVVLRGFSRVFAHC